MKTFLDITSWWWVAAIVVALCIIIERRSWRALAIFGGQQPATASSRRADPNRLDIHAPWLGLGTLLAYVIGVVALYLFVQYWGDIIRGWALTFFVIAALGYLCTWIDWKGVTPGFIRIGYLFGLALERVPMTPPWPTLWPLPWGETPTVIQPSKLYGNLPDGKDENGMEAFIRGLASSMLNTPGLTPQQESAVEAFWVKMSMYWVVVNHGLVQRLVMTEAFNPKAGEKARGLATDWEKTYKKTLEGKFFGKVKPHIRESLGKAHYDNIVSEQTIGLLNDGDKLTALNQILIPQFGVEMIDFAVEKGIPVREEFRNLMGGEALEELEGLKETKDLRIAIKLFTIAMEAVGYPAGTNYQSITDQEDKRRIFLLVNQAQGKINTGDASLADGLRSLVRSVAGATI